MENADSLLAVWIWKLNTNRSFGHVAVLLIDVPEVDEGTSLSWRDVPGFPKIGYQRAQVYLRYRGIPFAKLILNLDDEGYPRELFPELRPESSRTSASGEPLLETKPAFPLVTIVVPTAGLRPDLLKRCVKSLTALSYPAYEIVVVDNRSQSMFDEGTEIWSDSWIEECESSSKVTIVREWRPGASFARNTGVAAAHGEIVAFTDDDVEVDTNWLSSIVDAFNSSTEVKCVTGLVIPAELETETQEFFEMFCGGLDRGLVRAHGSFRVADHPIATFLKRSTYLVTESVSSEHSPAQSLYVVIGNSGVGANMAVRREFALRCPFDVALGAGSIAQAGEEGRFYADVLWAGFGIMYSPSAIVGRRSPARHGSSRISNAGLRDRLHGFNHFVDTRGPPPFGGSHDMRSTKCPFPLGSKRILRSESSRRPGSAGVISSVASSNRTHRHDARPIALFVKPKASSFLGARRLSDFQHSLAWTIRQSLSGRVHLGTVGIELFDAEQAAHRSKLAWMVQLITAATFKMFNKDGSTSSRCG